MNRSLTNVIFGGYGTGPSGPAAKIEARGPPLLAYTWTLVARAALRARRAPFSPPAPARVKFAARNPYPSPPFRAPTRRSTCPAPPRR
jgi:hypothetical protein